MRLTGAFIVALAVAVPAAAGEAGTRLKDVATLQGPSSVPLLGYGLVVGLAKTGDKKQTIFSTQTLANMLERFGVSVPAAQMKIENIAAVLVTAPSELFTTTSNIAPESPESTGPTRSEEPVWPGITTPPRRH